MCSITVTSASLNSDVPVAMQLVSKGEPLTIDESSLTGESLPVTRHTGDTLLSGAVITAGEGDTLVTATGKNSFFGKTIALLGDDDGRGHMQKVNSTDLLWHAEPRHRSPAVACRAQVHQL